MTTVAYSSPFIPAEWIAAHGVRPLWLRPGATSGQMSLGDRRGVCPYAGELVDTVLAGLDASALVLTTICDQMRYAAALLESVASLPVFLFSVPSTWQTPAARQLYRAELERLGRFLVRLGCQAPSPHELARVMLGYDETRAEARQSHAQSMPAAMRADNAVPLALIGGPLREKDDVIFDLIEQVGGRVVLDATEGGERTLPAPLDRQRTLLEPLDELTRAYFDTIPDVFRRPNDMLYQWLGQFLAARKVRGMLVRRYLWCDLWHAELHRLRAWSPVPVLEIDVARDEDCSLGRTAGRLEAFLEMLR